MQTQKFKRLDELQAKIFRRYLPHDADQLGEMTNLIQRPLEAGKIAELQRLRKRVTAEARSLIEAAEKEGRDLTPTEEQFTHAAAQVAINAVHMVDEHEHLVRSFEKDGGFPMPMGINRSSPRDEQKIIFRSNEKIAESRPAPMELRGMSVGRMMNIMVNGAEKANASEKEIRSMQEGVDSLGGYTVPTQLLGTFIDKMRAKSVCQQAGAVTVLLSSNKVNIARLATDPTVAWRLELGNVVESDATFDQVQFVAKSLACTIRLSKEVLADSININEALEHALANALALEVDRACLFGTGTDPQPRGIANVAGIPTVSVGAANGAAITNYAPILAAMQKLSEANSDPATGIVMAPRTLFTLAGLADSTGQPLKAPAVVAKIPMLDTNSVPINLTKGTSTNATKVIVGDFSQMMLGVRQSLEIKVLDEKYADTMEIGFRADLRFDVQFAHTASFCIIDGIIP